LLGDRPLLQEQHADFFIEIAHLLDEVLISLFRHRLLFGWNIGDLVG
jgi:hypothetical protein